MLSVMVTVNEHIAVLFIVSEARQETVVTPFGKLDPDGGVQVTVRAPSQLSVAIRPVKVSEAAQLPGATLADRFVQPSKIGACVSLTVTVNEQGAELPLVSLAVQLTVVTPF